MEPRKRSSHHENGSIKKKLDKLANDVKKLPAARQDKLKDLIGKRAYSTQNAAALLGISISTIRRLMHNGEIKFFRVGVRIRIASDEIERFGNMVNLKDAADILGVHSLTIRRLIKRGKLPAIRIGRPYRIAISDIEKIMESGTYKEADSKNDKGKRKED